MHIFQVCPILVYVLDNYYTTIFLIYGTALFVPKLQLKFYNCSVVANIVIFSFQPVTFWRN